jgi:hypothetical protein
MPFAGYKDFDECVRKNRDKKDPDAYCASIMKKVEDKAGGDTTTEHVVTDVFETIDPEFIQEGDSGTLKSRNTIIRVGKSKNGRFYRESTLRDAAARKVFDGVRMFVNHSEKLPTRRSMTEMVSGIESTWYDEKEAALKGDVVYFDKNFYDFAQRAKQFIGNSIAALVEGRKTKDSDGTYMEDISRIVKPRSVDWVVYPAAGGGVDAFISEGEEDVEWGDLTIELLEEHAPALVEELKKKFTPADPPADDKKDDPPADPPPSLTAEAVEAIVAKALNDATEKQTKVNGEQAKLREHVGKSGLPDRTRVRIMTQFSTAESFDQEAVDAAIKEAREELKAAGAGPKITGEGPTGNPGEKEKPARPRTREAVEAYFGGLTTKEAKKE